MNTAPASPQPTASTASIAPRAALRDLDDALADLMAATDALDGTEELATLEADRRVLAVDLCAGLDVPGHDNTSMDGYAVRVADLAVAAGQPLPVSQRIPAGHFGPPLQAGTVARVFTGAPIPDGADAVVMQEDAVPVGDGLVRFSALPAAGQWIRRQGEDVKRGAVVLRAGTRLGPGELGLAAGIGYARLTVRPQVRVALFSTGDELIMPGTVAPQDMPRGAIYNSNRFFLCALLRRMGCVVSDLGIVPDQRDATVAALAQAAANHDLVLTSGGVSVGEEDHIKPAIEQLGRLDLWQIGMKPGKPFAHGRVGAAHFIGLPGNPVSSFVTFVLLVRPFLHRLLGMPPQPLPVQTLPAHFDLPKSDRRREFLRARRNARGGLDLFPNQSSGVLTSVTWADGLIDNPPGHTIAQGQTVRFIPFSELLA